MPIVQAKCENCNGFLAVDDSLEAAICPFCNTPYIVQKAINNYNITNNINVGSGAVVNVYGSQNSDFVIEAGVLTKYQGQDDTVIIPDKVKSIGKSCFKGMQIVEVRLPVGIKRIEEFAFEECEQLKTINFPRTLEYIGGGAFYNCKSLESIHFTSNIEGLGTATRKVPLPYASGGYRYVEFSCFEDCNGLKSVYFDNSQKKIPGGTFNAFSMSLEQLYFPPSCTVSEYSFTGAIKCVRLDDVINSNNKYIYSAISVNELLVRDLNLLTPMTLSIFRSITRITVENPTFNENEQVNIIRYVKKIAPKCGVFTLNTSDMVGWRENGLCQYCGGLLTSVKGSKKIKKCMVCDRYN